MKRVPRYSPVHPRGRRRVMAFGLGVLGVFSLFWQPQTTLASYTDGEYAKVTITADSLDPIAPNLTSTAATVTGSWDAAVGDWDIPNYVFSTASSSTGANNSQIYSGPGQSATATTDGTSTNGPLDLTKISSGGTHACGVARGAVYCWGTSTTGALGLGATTQASTPALVGGFSGMLVTDVSAGVAHTCAVADGKAYCWGSGANGRTGTGGTTNTSTPTAVVGIPAAAIVTSISAGASHSCAVASSAAYCWGNNTNGRLGNSSTTSTTSAVAVTAATGLLAGRTVTAISAGRSHSCAVADGLGFCWGLNSNGQLGDASVTQRTAPVAIVTTGVLSGLAVTAVSAGAAHTCAVANAAAYCWGLTTNGRVGNGVITATNQSSPVAVTGTVAAIGKVAAVSAGDTHSCAIADGTAHCWGAGGSGQLGNGTTTASAGAAVAVTATGVLVGRTLTSISAGADFSCANGSTPGACWGLGTSGQLGRGSTTSSTTPVDADVAGRSCAARAVRLNATDCSLKQGTDYYARLGYSIGTWVAPNSSWQQITTKTRAAVSPEASAKTTTSLTLGWTQPTELRASYADYSLQRSTSANGANPVTIYRGGLQQALDRGGFAARTGLSTVDAVSAGHDHSCAIMDGLAYCWGDNANGELGIGSTTDTRVPTAVSTTGVLANKTVTEISAAMDDVNDGQHTCAIADGGVYCWGANAYGELGNASTTQSTVPVQAGTLSNVDKIATGYMHSCALTGGKVYCWGDNSRGQLGDSTNTRRTSPVLVAGLLAGKTVTDVTAGAAHTCAIAAGIAYCWGSNVSGQLGIGTSGSGTNSPVPVAVATSGVLNSLTVTQIAAGEAHTCVVASGKAYCWGFNSSGQVGNGKTTNALSPVAVNTTWTAGSTLASLSAGQYGTCLVASGKAYCWGENGSGQLGNNRTTDATSPVAVNTALMSGTVDQIDAGAAHTCARSAGAAYCWGANIEGRLGNNTTTASRVPVAVQRVAATPCATGATLIAPGTCSLSPGTTYYYRTTFTIDGGMSTSSAWVGIKTT